MCSESENFLRSRSSWHSTQESHCLQLAFALQQRLLGQIIETPPSICNGQLIWGALLWSVPISISLMSVALKGQRVANSWLIGISSAGRVSLFPLSWNCCCVWCFQTTQTMSEDYHCCESESFSSTQTENLSSRDVSLLLQGSGCIGQCKGHWPQASRRQP